MVPCCPAAAAPIVGAYLGHLAIWKVRCPQMPLTDIKVRSTKPRDKTSKLFDSGVLYLEVRTSGSRYWRWKYRFAGKEKRLAFGVYPDITLKAARDKRDTARQQLANGVDPGEARKAERVAQAGAESFERLRASGMRGFQPDG